MIINCKKLAENNWVGFKSKWVQAQGSLTGVSVRSGDTEESFRISDLEDNYSYTEEEEDNTVIEPKQTPKTKLQQQPHPVVLLSCCNACSKTEVSWKLFFGKHS